MRLCFLITSLFLFLTQSAIIAQSNTVQKLIGKWEGTDAVKEVGGFEFLDSVNVIITIPGQPKPPATYKIDTTKNPIWLDVTVGGLTLKSLIKFIDNNTLKWQAFYDGKRPTSFVKETGENTMFLKRKNGVKNN